MKLYIVQDDIHKYLFAAIIIADTKKEALEIAASKGFKRPKVVETHTLEKGYKTEFVE